ncbi:hypothetical protein K3181_01305 [Qipengyuania sp. YG27]|uniref:Tripartite tricarboxylate transporter TctB family protein n=1 Tax=Qipengyuania mesophila TaxID=2867246 RepID=A0ABS7JR02_9SPHN|nr:hypothetical protein [Qipengyuania mesophila]MBX7500077.1 hypothetical protein [Qipengyuania mesophila]
MSGFDFAFTLFGLVLGLAMAEVLAGFVRVLKARSLPASSSKAVGRTKKASSSAAVGRKSRSIRIGWMTPVMGGIVVVDLVTAWNLAWLTLQEVSISIPVLVAGMVETGLYFVAASLVWPDEAKDWADLDNWFDRHKAQIGICLAFANVGFWLLYNASGIYNGFPPALAPYILATAALPFTRTRRESALALAVLVTCLTWVVGISTLRLLGWTPWATGMVPLAG